MMGLHGKWVAEGVCCLAWCRLVYCLSVGLGRWRSGISDAMSLLRQVCSEGRRSRRWMEVMSMEGSIVSGE